MSDATLRQVLREAQRAGRLGVLSPEAAKLLRDRAAVLSRAVPSKVFPRTYCRGDRPSDSVFLQEQPETVRELGAFLAALEELL